ncbi:MAG: hypothetical protein ABI612_13155 [Betaproteobacteria bacterium]
MKRLNGANLKLEFFKDSKGGDTVLMVATDEGLRELRERLAAFSKSAETSLSLHDLAATVVGQHVELFAVRSPSAHAGSAKSFRLLCADAFAQDTFARLDTLSSGSPGHQYFKLLGSDARLLVSVGEFSEV